ncbi:MAG: hypothetical protein C5B47_00490 [Verrucomicrobia bacterium]|nr:MAG: hypothetical protein C5B47_00490 [Verrucomicrobiota bacterium]
MKVCVLRLFEQSGQRKSAPKSWDANMKEPLAFSRRLSNAIVVGTTTVILPIHLSLGKPVSFSPSAFAPSSTSTISLNKPDDSLLSPSSSKSTSEFIPNEAQRAAAEGNAAFAQGNFQRAIRAYEEVLQLAPNNLVGLVNLGIAQYRAGKTESAEKNLKHAISLRLETGTAWLALGTLYMDQNRLDEALAALAQAKIYEAQNPRVRNYLGVVMNRLGWPDAAESELRAAVELDTTYRDAHYNLAVIYMARTPPAFELAKRHYYIAIQCGAPRDANMEKTLKSPSPSQKFPIPPNDSHHTENLDNRDVHGRS